MIKKSINLVSGGAGFLGSHLIDALIKNGEKVICIDNFISGKKENIFEWINNPNFDFISHDIVNPINLKVDKIWHLACPASPLVYERNSLETIKTNFLGTLNMLELSKKNEAKILIASSSAIYGNPEIHPQFETYFGSVNSFGKRSCYEEGKRVAETLCFEYQKVHNCDIRIARIFNCYGPKMNSNDGRVITNFIVQALNNKPITIYGDGSQTRSFCFIDDLIKALFLLMESNYNKPINIGSNDEMKIIDLAKLIKKKTNSNSNFVFRELPINDPLRRKPSILLAKEKLNWDPKENLNEGLNKTIRFLRENLI